jgi:peptidylprolyl isomerase
MVDKIKKGDKVKVEYTGKLADGKVFDTSKGRDPLSFEMGAKQIIPGFEKNVEGMKVGEEKTFTLSVEESYGPVKKELVQEIPRDKLPKEQEPQEGMMLMMKAPTGQQIPARIVKVAEDKVTLDLNHPLAGKELTFEVKVVGVNEPEEEKKEEDSGCSDCSSCSSCK